MIYVLDGSDLESISRLSDEDVDLSDMFNIQDFSIDESNGKAHVIDTSKAYIYDLSTGNQDSNFTPPSIPNSICIDVSNDSNVKPVLRPS